MESKFPDFEELVELAENNPEALEELRTQLEEEIIQGAPESSQRRLRGLQFQLQMERQKSKTPLAACMVITRMMLDSLDRLRGILNDPEGVEKTAEQPSPSTIGPDSSATIISFRQPEPTLD